MMKKIFSDKNPYFIPILTLILVSSVAGSSYFFGFKRGAEKPKNIIVEGVSHLEKPQEIQTDFNTFWQAWEVLKENHINSEKFSAQKAVYGAIRGLAGSMDDPHTTYFDPAQSKAFMEDISGKFGGVGMEIGIKNDTIMVIAPLKNTPAERAGLKPSDYILKIDGRSTENLTVEEAVSLIRGDVGTTVKLTVIREGWTDIRDFEITREIIQAPVIEWKMAADGMMHLQFYRFTENSHELFYNAVSEAIRQGARGMILDLRSNPGGPLEVTVEIAGWFIDKGKVVVQEEFSSGFTNSLRSNGPAWLRDFPVVALINSGSASASEILAGALRDQRGVKLVGLKSYGKGSVQQLFPLPDDSTLKITIAKWLLPSGKVIEKNGLEPDYKVELPEAWTREKPDPQLNKAIEILEKQIKK